MMKFWQKILNWGHKLTYWEKGIIVGFLSYHLIFLTWLLYAILFKDCIQGIQSAINACSIGEKSIAISFEYFVILIFTGGIPLLFFIFLGILMYYVYGKFKIK